MKKYCCVPHCPRQTCGINSMARYYTIPRDPLRREKWINRINSGPNIATIKDDGAAVCSFHFKESDLKSSEQSANIAPSIFPWTSNWSRNGTHKESLGDTTSSHSNSCNLMLNEILLDMQCKESLIKSPRQFSQHRHVPDSSDIMKKRQILETSSTCQFISEHASSITTTHADISEMCNRSRSPVKKQRNSCNLRVKPQSLLFPLIHQQSRDGHQVNQGKNSSESEPKHPWIKSEKANNDEDVAEFSGKQESTSNNLESLKMKISRQIYQCPHCDFLVRTVSNFHQHFIAHEKSPLFKCSKCDFDGRYRTTITKHIEKSPKSTHEGASWTLVKEIPENQYAEYLTMTFVAGFSLPSTTILESSSGLSYPTSHSEFEKKRKETEKSWGNLKMPAIEEDSQESGYPSSPKRIRIDSDETIHHVESETHSEVETRHEGAVQFGNTKKLLDDVLASSLFQKAEMKRRQDELNIFQKQEAMDLLKKKLCAMKEANTLRERELLECVERRKRIQYEIEQLPSLKDKIQRQIQIHQCEVLKLQFANSSEESTKKALDSSLRKCAILEKKEEERIAYLSKIKRNLQNLNQQYKEAEELRVAAAKQITVTQSEIANEQLNLLNLQESFSANMLKIEGDFMNALNYYVGSAENVTFPDTSSTPLSEQTTTTIEDSQSPRRELPEAEQHVEDQSEQQIAKIKSEAEEKIRFWLELADQSEENAPIKKQTTNFQESQSPRTELPEAEQHVADQSEEISKIQSEAEERIRFWLEVADQSEENAPIKIEAEEEIQFWIDRVDKYKESSKMKIEAEDETIFDELNCAPKFPMFETAVLQRQQDERKISEKQQEIKTIQLKLKMIKESTDLGQLELSELEQRRPFLVNQITHLKEKRNEIEVQIRVQQAEELKLQLANVSGVVSQLLSDSQKRVAESESVLSQIIEEIASSSKEYDRISPRIKEVEEMLITMLDDQNKQYSCLTDAKTELRAMHNNLLTISNPQVEVLLDSERNNIVLRFKSLEQKVCRAETILKICQKEQEWLTALQQYVEENFAKFPLNV